MNFLDGFAYRNLIREACESLGYSGKYLEALVIIGSRTRNGSITFDFSFSTDHGYISGLRDRARELGRASGIYWNPARVLLELASNEKYRSRMVDEYSEKIKHEVDKRMHSN